jgi:hypothetical protein
MSQISQILVKLYLHTETYLLTPYLPSHHHVYAQGSIFIFNFRNQNGPGAHPASYPMGTGGSFPGGKAAGA